MKLKSYNCNWENRNGKFVQMVVVIATKILINKFAMRPCF